MTINKFQGKTKEEAIEKAKAEFGEGAVIMNVKEVKPKGLMAFFRSSTYEVTAAIEEKESFAADIASFASMTRARENINLAADEEIAIPQPVRTPEIVRPELKSTVNSFPVSMNPNIIPEVSEQEKLYTSEREFKERLDNLSELLAQQLSQTSAREVQIEDTTDSEELNFVRMIYTTLLKNEVDEKYINMILDDIDKFIRPGNNIDSILPNIYQKLVLKFGQPKTIELSGKKPNIVCFIGPTGVGKTTTIAKIASKYKVEYNCKVAFITADTYRIAAAEQLRVYANIMDAPMSIVYSPEEINDEIEKYMDYDLIFVDTAGFSHKNESQKADIKKFLAEINKEYHKEVYLVLSATTKYEDLLSIVDVYQKISKFNLIFTKLDETSTYGNLLNIKLYADADLSYTTNGQNVPVDIEVFDTQKIVKQLLGGK